jgi:putative iron-regulated protein
MRAPHHAVLSTKQLGFALIALAVVVLLGGCSRQKQAPLERKAQALSAEETRAVHAALVSYADIGAAAYADAALGVRGLLGTVDRFLHAPSAVGLSEVRQGWIDARRSYQQTEVFRFYDGPIDRVELLINTWPIDESYVEAGLAAKPGIIENTSQYPDLSQPLLVSLNAKQGETSISTGYHVIEFLLWGRDTRADGPGDRSYTDFVSSNSPLAERRSRYLRVAIELLAEELEGVQQQWAKDADNYRKKFLDLPPLTALGLMIKGMGSLSGPELAGERLTVAYETKDQENEHSCFSDQTVADLADDVLGIENVARGSYTRTDGSVVKGPGLYTAIALRNSELGRRLEGEISASLTAVRSIPNPFDQSMLGADTTPGRKAIASAITALEKQTQTLTEIAELYDLRALPAAPSP